MKRKTDTVLPFRLSYEDRAALSELAKAKGKTLSSTVRGIVQSNEEVSSMRNVVTRKILDQIGFVGDQGKARRQPGVVNNLTGAFDRMPITRNGVYFEHGLLQYQALEQAKKEMRTKGMSDEMIVKELDSGLVNYVPSGVTTWEALDQWREMAAVGNQMAASASDMQAMMENVLSDESITDKGKTLAALADGFTRRMGRQTKEKRDPKAKEILAKVESLAKLHLAIYELKQSVDRLTGA